MKFGIFRAAVAVAAALVASGASASQTSEWSYIGQFQQSGGLTSTFNNSAGLSGTFNNASGLSTKSSPQASTFTLDSATSAASTAASQQTPIAFPSDQAATPAALSVTLWAFVAAVQSQQFGEPLLATASSANALALTLEGVPAVPLPPPSWLLAAGLCCLALVRRRITLR